MTVEGVLSLIMVGLYFQLEWLTTTDYNVRIQQSVTAESVVVGGEESLSAHKSKSNSDNRI